jgi:hypothetical protein
MDEISTRMPANDEFEAVFCSLKWPRDLQTPKATPDEVWRRIQSRL